MGYLDCRLAGQLAILISLFGVGAAQAAVPVETENISTFSVCAYDPNTGEVGVAVQSKFFGVGVVVPWCKAGVGAVASQAFGNPNYGPQILELLAHGYAPSEAVSRVLSADKDAEQRQIGVAWANARIFSRYEGADGSFAPPADGYSDLSYSYTGRKCMDWAGGLTGIAPDGVVYACQGNILAGPEVVEAMAAAMEDPASVQGLALTETQRTALGSDFAGRLLGALIAGQAKGGDSRGMQSSALKVSQAGAGYGGYSDVKYDLRVDDATDPFEELARLMNIARPWALTLEAYNKLNNGNMPEAVRLFTELTQLQPDEAGHFYNLACALARSGEGDAAMAALSKSLSMDTEGIYKALAPQDTDLTSLRERADFQALLGQ
jgi:uncharacterized Ntn-hydrolase superfamily protein